MPEIVGKDLAAADMGGFAQPLKLFPDIRAVQGLSVSGNKRGAGCDIPFAAVGQ